MNESSTPNDRPGYRGGIVGLESCCAPVPAAWEALKALHRLVYGWAVRLAP
jgi:hypothetical protein